MSGDTRAARRKELNGMQAWAAYWLCVAAVCGFAIGIGKPVLALATVVFAVIAGIAVTRRGFLALAVAMPILLPVDTFSTANLGLPKVSFALLLIPFGLFHVYRASASEGSMRPLKWNRFDFWVAAYAASSAVGAYLTAPESLNMLVGTVLASLAPYAVIRLMSPDADDVRFTVRIAVLAGAVMAVSLLADMAAGRALFVGADYAWQVGKESAIFRPGGFLGVPTRSADMLVMVLAVVPLALEEASRFWRASVFASVALLLAGIAVTFTRSAWIATLVCVFVYLAFTQGRRVALATASTLAVTGVAAAAAFSATGTFKGGVVRIDSLLYRLDLYRFALAGLFSRPLGVVAGLGTNAAIDSSFSLAPDLAVSGTHNGYLTMLVEQGILGVVALAGLLVVPVVSGVRALVRRMDVCWAFAALGTAIAMIISATATDISRQYALMAFYLVVQAMVAGRLAAPVEVDEPAASEAEETL